MEVVEITKVERISSKRRLKFNWKLQQVKKMKVQIVFKMRLWKNTEIHYWSIRRKVILTIADGTKNEVADESTSTVKKGDLLR